MTHLRRPVVLVEGVPGAGKTSVLQRMREAGQIVVGELPGSVRETGTTEPYAAEHHWSMWAAKTPYIAAATRDHGLPGAPVYVDRYWPTELVWEPEPGGRRTCADWVWEALGRGHLIIPSALIIVDVSENVSLARRRERLVPGHGWSDRDCLADVRRFYADLAAHVRMVHPPLAQVIGSIPTLRLDGELPVSELAAAIQTWQLAA
jgi:thymidylate kinase